MTTAELGLGDATKTTRCYASSCTLGLCNAVVTKCAAHTRFQHMQLYLPVRKAL
jgi:hypothetical protein